MQTETYEVTESLDQTEMQQLANDGEVALLIESLGLEGQKKIMSPTGTQLPYRQITAQEKLVFECLFPKKCDLTEYKDGPIPLRVMQAAAHVKSLELEDLAMLQVWYPTAGKDDPVLVARKSYWQSPIYLIARWGQALLPFEELKRKATKIIEASCKQKLLKGKQEIDMALTLLTSRVDEAIETGSEYNPYIYV